MRLDLAAAVELVVERLALGVVPVLVDPAERHVVGPAALQRLGVQGVDDVPERRRRDRDKVGHARRTVEARQLGGEVLEDQPEQERVPLGLIVAARSRAQAPGSPGTPRLSQPPVTTAGARSGCARGARCLHEPEQDQPVQQGVGGLLLGLAAEVFCGPAALRPGSGLCPDLLGHPRLQPPAPGAGGLVQSRVAAGHREPVGSLRGGVEVLKQAGAERPDGRRERVLRVGGHGHGCRHLGHSSRTRAPARTCSSRRPLISSTSALHVGLRSDLAVAQLQVDAGDERAVASAQYLVEEVVRLDSRRAAARA